MPLIESTQSIFAFSMPRQWIHAPQHFAVRFPEDGKILRTNFFLKVGSRNPMVTPKWNLSCKEPIITKKIVLLIPNWNHFLKKGNRSRATKHDIY